MNLILAILMSLTFTTAPRVEVGDKPTSTDMAALAESFNQRERSGLGDFNYRTSNFWEHYFLDILNGEGDLASPLGAFFFFWQHIDPSSDITGPEAGPGEEGGANVSSPPNAFTFGIDEIGFEGEEGRFVHFPFTLGGGPSGVEGIWELGKQQRGVIDPISGDQNAPAIATARSSQALNYSSRYPYRMGTGGFFPYPNVLAPSCGATEATGSTVPSLEIKFTALDDGVSVPSNNGAVTTVGDRSVITYAGSCPYYSDDVVAGHVQYIQVASGYFVIGVWDGSQIVTDYLPTSDWTQGPYTGEGYLSRYDGGHYSRILWQFVNDFRGTPAQRTPDTFNIKNIAFSFEEFNSNQYLLAPNIGFSDGVSLYPIYPQAKISADSSIPSGTILRFSGDSIHAYGEGFTCAAVFAKAINLSHDVTLDVMSGETIIAQITLTPDAPASIVALAKATRPDPLQVVLATDARFSAPGSITFEATELLEYLPDHFDAYLVLRASSTRGGTDDDATALDATGITQANANDLYRSYLTNAAIVSGVSGLRSVTAAINTTPAYEAARRMSQAMMRIIRRQECVSYEVTGGKSVVRFKRHAFGERSADIFKGIAPDETTATDIKPGTVYVCRSHTGGTIIYKGIAYTLNQRFTGEADDSTFEATGDALCLEYEGIKSTAQPKGWTNEWLMTMETKVYHPSDSSLWKEDNYADWYLRNNRCMFYATAAMPLPLAAVTDIPNDVSGEPSYLHLSPEAPSGWNFTLGMNSDLSSVDGDGWCKSCQIYRAPYEIESATVEFDSAGRDIVKLVFKTRFQTNDLAVSSVNVDPTAWDGDGTLNNIRVTQTYRTDDNAMCEFIAKERLGKHGVWKTGDAAADSTITGTPDNPFGSILPTFFFTKLMPKPYEDGNDTWNPNDSRIGIDPFLMAEIKLKAWCEGCIDGVSTQSNICGGGGKTYDYKFENLCFDAFGGSQICDFKSGHGPMVNTKLRGSMFNKIASCINLLNRFRVDGLMKFELRQILSSGSVDKEPTSGSGQCPPAAGLQWDFSGCPPSTIPTSTGSWGSIPFVAEAIGSSHQCGPSGGSLAFNHDRTDIEFRYAPNAGFENAIPTLVQDLLDNGSIGVIGTATRHYEWNIIGPNPVAPYDCGGGAPFTTVDYQLQTRDDDLGCMELTSGFVSGGSAPCGVFAGCAFGSPVQNHERAGSVQRFTFTKLSEDGSAMIVVPVVEASA